MRWVSHLIKARNNLEKASIASPAGDSTANSFASPTWSWLVGFGLTLALGWLYMVGELSVLFWLLVAALMIGWGIWALKNPLPAFIALVFIWITVYSRASLAIFTTEEGGGSNRGGLSLGDLLWIVYTGTWLWWWLRHQGWRIVIGSLGRAESTLLPLTLFLLISLLLPVIGVLVAGYPVSYAIPGFRYLQWASFALFAYTLIRSHNRTYFVRLLLAVFAFAGLVHSVYALIQTLVPLGILHGSWLYLDHIFAQRFSITWFFYPRTTGLCINPNHYGLFGSVLVCFYCASVFSNIRTATSVRLLLLLSGIWAIASASSRSAVLGLLTGLCLMGTIAWLRVIALGRQRELMRFYRFLFLTGVFAICSALFAAAFLPPLLSERVRLLIDIVNRGAEVDPNATGRFEFWSTALRAFEEQNPWGTLVPSGYALNMPIDSFYVSLIVQGTPFYLLIFCMLLGGLLWLSWRNVHRVCSSDVWIGFSTIGTIGIVILASATLSPLQNAVVIAPFWTLTGMAFAAQMKSQHAS